MHYLILSVSKSHAQLFEVKGDDIRPIAVEGMPTSKADAWKGMEREDLRMGGSPKEVEEQEEDKYMHMIASSVQTLVHEAHLPLVFAGVEEEYGMFKKFDASKMLVDDYIQGSPDQLHMKELKEKADPIVKTHLMTMNEKHLDEYGNLQGTGRTSTDRDLIMESAKNGKVDLLLVEDGSEGDIQDVASHVWAHRGRVLLIEAAKMPEGAKMAAVLRY